jgi:2,3-dihydroxy-p-cumate/2,3-dihydroxybenzoate 3,4-dioxygenase
MIDLQRIQYVRVGTPNLDEAAAFATTVLGLQPAGRARGMAYFRSDDRDHTLCYVEGDPKTHVAAFEVSHTADLDAIAGELENAGVAVHRGSRVEAEQRRVEDFIGFADPSGNPLEIVWRPHAATRRYFPRRDAGITGFSHIGLNTTDARKDEAFWTRILNARVSDWIGPAPLIRVNQIHHTVALLPTTSGGLQHINHQVASADDVMRSWYLLREQRGIRIVFGPGRHTTSGATFLYFEGLDGMIYEYSCGVRVIEDEATYKPRQFPFSDESFTLWGGSPDIPAFRKAVPALAMAG